MVHRRSRASGASGQSLASFSELLLTDNELAELDRAVAESGAWTRSLLIFEALHAGLLAPDLVLTKERRSRRVLVRVSATMLDDIRRLASSHGLAQQTVLRHFVLRFIAKAPWNRSEESQTESPRELGVAAQ